MCNNLQRTKLMALVFGSLLSLSVSAQTTITDEAGLKAIADNPSGSFVLSNDITLSGEWTPLGTEAVPFTGTLDGAGHAIKGLKVTASSSLNDAGLFGYAKGATLKNVRIINARVDGNERVGILVGNSQQSTIDGVMTSGVVTGRDHVGGIVGHASGDVDNGLLTQVSNCFSTAGVYSREYQPGGIAGIVNAGVLDKNFFMGSVTAELYSGAGGMSALIDGGAATFTNNVSTAYYIKGSAGIGGDNPYEHAHSIVGWNNNGTENFGSNLGSAATIIESGGEVRDHADLAGDMQGTETSVEDLQKAATYTALGWGSEWSLADGRYPVLTSMTVPFDGDAIFVNTLPGVSVTGGHYESGAKSPLGRTVTITSSDPSVATVDGTKISFVAPGTVTITYATTGDNYISGATLTQSITVSQANYNITSAEDLLNIKNNTEGDYKFAADIDMSGVTFSPLPDFTGSLDGQGHVIRNLTFSNTDRDNTALFATTHGATIKNLGIEDANLVGNANTAAIVGQAYGGSITSCYVANSYIEGRDHVASIVGNMGVNGDEGVTISDCLSNAVVNSRQYQAGGLVGVANGGTLKNCYFSGTVDGKQSCQSSAVSLLDSDGHLTTVENVLSAAAHIYGPGPNRIINKAGRNCTLNNNYGIASTNIAARGSLFSKTSDAAGEEGETVEDATAKTKDFYVNKLGWDFDNTWKFINGTEGKMYPVLKWMNAPLKAQVFDLPSKDESVLYKEGAEFESLSPIHGSWGQSLKYTITAGKDLVSISADEPDRIYVGNDNGEFVGSGNVTVSVSNADDVVSVFNMSATDFTFFVDQEGLVYDIKTADNFVNKISRNLSGSYKLSNDIDMSGVDFSGIAMNDKPFSGTLDGQGYKVKNLTVNFATGENVGVFGQTSNATFKNIAFENVNINAAIGVCNHVGLVGSCVNTSFDQVAVTGKVTGRDHVALLAGDGDDIKVTNSYVAGTVTAYMQAGGFVGCTLTGGATFNNSYSNVNIECTYRGWAGGFIGLIDKSNSTITITNCVSLGNCKSAGDGTPHVAAPFIAGNGAGDTPNAIINFSNNIYNSEATMDADGNSNAWPAKNETADGGSVEAATAQNTTVLQQDATYTNLTWDFDKVWKINASGDYKYPVLQVMKSEIASGIGIVNITDPSINAENGSLNMANLVPGTRVSIYTVSGKKIADVTASALSSSVNLPMKGLYIVTVKDGASVKSFKIMSK